MKKTLLVAALMLGASSASAYEVHKNVSKKECELIEYSLPKKGYSNFAHMYSRDNFEVDDIWFYSVYLNEKTNKVVSFRNDGVYTGNCNIFVGTTNDLDQFRKADELAKQKKIDEGKAIASKYGL